MDGRDLKPLSGPIPPRDAAPSTGVYVSKPMPPRMLSVPLLSVPLLLPLDSKLLLAPKDGALRGRPARGLPLPPLMLSCRAMLLKPRVGVGAASGCAALRVRGNPPSTRRKEQSRAKK